VTRFLLMLHFLGLAMAFAWPLGGFVIGLVVNLSPPGDAPIYARLGPKMRTMGQTGLGFLVVTGLLILWRKWDWTAPHPAWFVTKMVCVALVLGAAGLLSRLTSRSAAGDMVAFGRMPFWRRIAITLLGFAIVFAVLAFE